ncbi:MAG: DUF1287 domain-containing protein [Asticcacaulis sp.]
MKRRDFLMAAPVLALAGCGKTRIVPTQGVTAQFISAARSQTRHFVLYDSKYTKIPYPNGDVALGKGVCADVIIRAYRAIGIDLQRLVHEDMIAHFDLYPKRWGLKAPDPNIDHRRVPNLMVFFSRFGQSLPVTQDPAAWKPGDMITNLPAGGTHIAIVSDRMTASGRPMVIQNAGWGVQENDDLLRYPILGHYRYAL